MRRGAGTAGDACWSGRSGAVSVGVGYDPDEQDLDVVVSEAGDASAGAGARVWAASVLLARLLVGPKRRALVEDKAVLEVGAGCGVAGLAAARHGGASSVALTDCARRPLANLRASCLLQPRRAGEDAEAETSRAWSWNVAGAELRVAYLRFGEHDLGAESAPRAAWRCAETGPGARWERVDGLVVDRTAAAPAGARQDAAPGAAGEEFGVEGAHEDAPPGLRKGETFDTVVGADVLYTDECAESLPSVLAARLRPGGTALLVVPLRDAGYAARVRTFLVRAEEAGLAVDAADAGVAGEGGAFGTARDAALAAAEQATLDQYAFPPVPRTWDAALLPDEPRRFAVLQLRRPT